jgi:hypothetical protein
VLASLALHLVIGLVGRCAIEHDSRGKGSTSLVDIELAPAAPAADRLPEEDERVAVQRPVEAQQPEVVPTQQADEQEEEAAGGAPDARVDARPRRPRPDAEEMLAVGGADAAMFDAAPAGFAQAGADGATALALVDPFSGAGAGAGADTGSGSGAVEAGSPGTDDDIAAGTNANLLAYMPAGHVLTVLIRFDRLRDTPWQEPAEKLFQPMPDHLTLIGDRDLHLADLFDLLVISSPEPQNPRVTTLVAKSRINRASLRDLLDEPETPVTWRAAKGGMLGARGRGTRVIPGDRRVFLAPDLEWITLAQGADLGGLTAAAAGDLDTVVASVPVPAWLEQVRHIADETGTPTGPALVATLTSTEPRIAMPDFGLDVASIPGPQRMTIALEVVAQGFIVRGNLRFASEADAAELVESVTRARQRALDSTVLSGLLRRSRVLNAVKGLSLDRRGARVSYATSLSVADAQGLLALAAQTLDVYFRAAAEAPAPAPAPGP